MYLRGFYWSVAGITAMVIGDVPPVTPMETAYMLLVVAVVSVFVSATAINNFTDLVAGVNSAKVGHHRARRAPACEPGTLGAAGALGPGELGGAAHEGARLATGAPGGCCAAARRDVRCRPSSLLCGSRA